jgi:hypothetical protein
METQEWFQRFQRFIQHATHARPWQRYLSLAQGPGPLSYGHSQMDRPAIAHCCRHREPQTRSKAHYSLDSTGPDLVLDHIDCPSRFDRL